MASKTTSPSLKPRRGKGKTNVPAIPSVSASVSVTPASTPAANEATSGKLDSIMMKVDKLNVLDELVVQVTNLTKSLEFCHESIELN